MAPAAVSSTEETTRAAAQILVSWNALLRECDPAFAALQEEKLAGWTSAAVERYWREKDREFAGTVDRRAVKHGGKNRAPGTAKYVRFYRAWMARLDPHLFAIPAAADMEADAGARRVVVDIGSSPGGMCEYLVGELGFRGYAFSLACDDEGFGMQFAHPDLAYADCDSAQEGAWRFMLKHVPEGGCDFVNGGIVVDRGQVLNPRSHTILRPDPSCGSQPIPADPSRPHPDPIPKPPDSSVHRRSPTTTRRGERRR